MATSEAELFRKIRALPNEKIAEVEDFVDFLRHKLEEQALARATMKLSESTFSKAWDNPEDAEYDRL